MYRKSILIMAVMFVCQLLYSCFPCGCDEPKDYEVIYNDVSVTAYNTAGFQYKAVEDTVNKNAFGVGIYVISELKQIAKSENPVVGFGFSPAMACSCRDDIYGYTDPVDKIKIFATDVQTSKTIEVTDYFAVQSYSSGELMSLQELFDNMGEGNDSFQFELADYQAIPNSAIFTVEAYLKSGKKFSNQTEQINFFE